MKKPIAVLRYLLSVHILTLFILSIFRFALYLSNSQQVADVEDKYFLLFVAMLKGVQFDNMISCYIIALPALVLLVLSLFDKMPKMLVKAFGIYFIVLYTLVFAISAADIPYFAYYFSHISGSALNFLMFGDTFGMLFQESSYYIYFGFFLLMAILFGFFVLRFGKMLEKAETANLRKKDYKYYIPLVIVVLGICFIGIRGRLGRYPLRVSGAYFCNNSFINQLGVNPSFFLIKTMSKGSDKKDRLADVMDRKAAIAYVQKAFGLDSLSNENYPVSRYVITEGEARKANVVIILMESLSAEYLKMEHEGKPLIPFIHELIGKSYYFENFYSAGVHTNNGIASTLYGFPPIFEKTMMAVQPNLYTGLPVTLKEKGYQTIFLLTHDPQYDNLYAFVSENGFNKVYSQYDYPSEKLVNNFGVQDDFLFEYGLNRLNEASKKDNPFFATFMTVSNHPPYIVPDKFKNAGSTDEESIIAFSDNSLKEFMEGAAAQEWYNNTIFVILGDHGRVMGKQAFDMSLSYNHTPLIIFSPLFDDAPKRFEQFGGQVDIFPTIMGLLNQPYENNSMGIDLFKEVRPYMYFVSDHHLGCINDKYFYIYNPDTKADGLYDYRNMDNTNIKPAHTAIADSMKTYAVSMMITADYLMENKLTRPGSAGKNNIK